MDDICVNKGPQAPSFPSKPSAGGHHHGELVHAMDDGYDGRKHIERHLSKVECIEGFTWTQAMASSVMHAGRFIIDKFNIKHHEFTKWLATRERDGAPIKGLEYDAKRELIIIRATSTAMHKSVTGVLSGWFTSIARRLTETSGIEFKLNGSTRMLFSLICSPS